jgi:cytochrome P450
LPVKAIADLIGFPEDDHDKLFRWTNAVMAAEDPYAADYALAAMTELMGYSIAHMRHWGGIRNWDATFETRIDTAGLNDNCRFSPWVTSPA